MGATHPTPAEQTDPLSARLEGLVPDPIGPDIDERMANLLKDHQDMGARPKRDKDNGDLFPADQPLNQSITRHLKTEPKPKATPKKK